jgi:hypothetical protein
MQTNYLKQLLGKNEQIILVARQHWLVLVGEILSESVLTLALIVLISLVWQVWIKQTWVALGYLLLVFPLISLWRDVLIWANQQFVVTTRRIIQLEGVLHKHITDSSLEKVNDVKLTQSVWGRLFDYGDIEILTASEMGVNVFRRIGAPIKFKTVMVDAKDKLGGDSNGGGRSAAPDIPAMITQLDNLRKQGVLTEEEFGKKKAELLAKM